MLDLSPLVLLLVSAFISMAIVCCVLIIFGGSLQVHGKDILSFTPHGKNRSPLSDVNSHNEETVCEINIDDEIDWEDNYKENDKDVQ